jgi:thiosulfate dehydrogenase (quinone) large subunit
LTIVTQFFSKTLFHRQERFVFLAIGSFFNKIIKTMEEKLNPAAYTATQSWLLVILRVLIGWHFLYEGMVKLWNPGWSAGGYLMDSKGLFANLFYKMAASPNILSVVDFLNVWGLILIGLGLMLGVLTRWALIGGIVLLSFYYLSHPALIGVKYAMPSEGSYLLVNKNLIEIFAMAVLLVFPTGKMSGIDGLFSKWYEGRRASK